MQKNCDVEKYNPFDFNYIESGVDNLEEQKELYEEYDSENSNDKDNSKKNWY